MKCTFIVILKRSFHYDFSAPEILKKEHYGQEVDWWSLGVLACVLLTNKVRDRF